MMRVRLVLAVAAVLMIASCSSKSSSAASNTTSSTAAPASTTTTTSPPPPQPARCEAYHELAAINHAAVTQQTQLASDWPKYQAALAADFTRNRVLYATIARESTGALRADALVVAAFMPRSRTLLLRSATFAAYRAAVAKLAGDDAVRAAATSLNTDAAHSCTF